MITGEGTLDGKKTDWSLRKREKKMSDKYFLVLVDDEYTAAAVVRMFGNKGRRIDRQFCCCRRNVRMNC